MKFAHGLAAVLVVLGAQAAAEAQFLVPAFGPAPAPFGGVRFSYRSRNFALGGAIGSPYFGGGFPGSPYFGYPPFGMAGPNVTIVYGPPPQAMSQPIIINQPIVVPGTSCLDQCADSITGRVEHGDHRRSCFWPREYSYAGAHQDRD